MSAMYRQGDVLIRRIDSIPTSAKRVDPDKTGRLILAEGETTGHAHAIPGTAGDLFADGDSLFLDIKQPTKLVHEEHDHISIDPGFYEVVGQREYHPEKIRRVLD